MTTHSVDDLLVKDMQNQQAPVQAIPNNSEPPAQPQQPEPEHASDTIPRLSSDPKDQGVESQDQSQASEPTNSAKNDSSESVGSEQKASNIDEYGNPIEKPRVYTEDEVQRMIRDRLSRGRHAEQQQPTQQQVQKTADEFKADPNSEESWEVQLDRFIDRRIETREREMTQRQWQQQEAQKQADFEAKFSSGMSKYQDFEQVVSKAAPSITPSMMLATRSLDNPAAFVYAAAKLHPADLDRIARIGDPYVQAAEVGRLHERMVKSRGAVSNAPKPIETVKGDVPNKPLNNERSLDQRIFDYAKQKRR